MLLLDPKPATHPYLFRDDGLVPNSHLPAIVYRNAINLTGMFRDEQARELSEHAAAFDWRLDWADTDAVYRFTHYHSTAHELLIVLEGSADIELGGTSGKLLRVHDGDMLAIPAGVGHKRVRKHGKAFSVAGLYPEGTRWDLCRLHDGEYERAKRAIAKVPLPKLDPIYGNKGPLLAHWK